MEREQWLEFNRRYLIASVNVIKAELSRYQIQADKNGDLTDADLALERTKHDLRMQEEKLTVSPYLKTLVNVFHLSSFEEKILLMCIGVEIDVQFVQIIQKFQGDSGQSPTLGLALAAFEDAHWSALSPDAPLRRWHLIELNNNSLLSQATCRIDEHILHFVAGIESLDHHLQDFFKLVVPEAKLVSSHQILAEKLKKDLSSNYEDRKNYPLLQLLGNSHKEKLNIIAVAFASHGLSTYRLPTQLIPHNYSELMEMVRLWNRDALLFGHVLFLDDSQDELQDQKTCQLITYMMENIPHILVLGSNRKISVIDRELLSIAVLRPTQEEQRLLWEQHLSEVAEGMDGISGNLVNQFDLDSNTIINLAREALYENRKNGNSTAVSKGLKEQLWEVCCTHTRPNLGHLAQRIEPVAKWDDLVLPEFQKAILNEIAIHVQQRQKVYFDWGFSGKSKRGLGISALFAGESGTGKTMASEVLANELNLDLYRIDLSQVVNKYIGETEKNLKKIFDAAEGSGAILLFDEADALFGKRSEVKDSHDRYSNIEVSYLLQKMEEYRGLAILTTNMKNALDKAFLRRIRFVVQFPFPDTKMRAEIWKRTFPLETPRDDLDYLKLGALNIPGGNIRNIAINASFAAANKNQPVSMQDIRFAARSEYQKLDKQMGASESLQ
ncbi:MAG TPA: ATP-binding protein [Lunatimonas sp.]|nr:ATP-binding protein [Lunatimonas sp.]